MPEFHKVSLADKEWIKERLAKEERLSCEFTFGNMFSYCAKICIHVADYEGFLITRCKIDNYISYCCPLGSGDMAKAIDFIIEDAKLNGENRTFVIYGISPKYAKIIEEVASDKVDLFLERDAFDYVYLSSDLINLTGKKFQPKRNHISYFKKNYDWQYEKITKDNIAECLSMSEKWLEQSQSDSKADLEKELKIIKLVFENYEALDYVGGLIRVDGEVIAYTMGEKMNDDMFCVHIEKAFYEYRGAYPMINQQFVTNELSNYMYINREDDVGLENLRKAKNSYNPVFMLEKYEATLK